MDAVLVAGGTGGLGEAVLRTLLAAGRPVVATYRREAERERIEQQLDAGPRLQLVHADLLQADAAERAVATVDRLGAVVNLVGGYAGGRKVHEIDADEFDRMLALNLRPAFLLARATMPRLTGAGGGAFVAVSARAALQPFSGAAAYIAAKAAVLAFVRALDAEYRDAGVRCNAVLPSVIDTPANRRSQPDADHRRWVAPEEIARVVEFLVSDASSATSGAAIPVYGRA